MSGRKVLTERDNGGSYITASGRDLLSLLRGILLGELGGWLDLNLTSIDRRDQLRDTVVDHSLGPLVSIAASEADSFCGQIRTLSPPQFPAWAGNFFRSATYASFELPLDDPSDSDLLRRAEILADIILVVLALDDGLDVEHPCRDPIPAAELERLNSPCSKDES
jgi:hypothetical protein